MCCRFRLPRPQFAGDAEVQHPPGPVGHLEQVARLQVAVNDPPGMGGGESLADGGDEVARARPGDRPAFPRPARPAERCPVEEFHDRVGATPVGAGGEHGYDPRTVDRRDPSGFAFEGVDGGRTVEKGVLENLHRHVATRLAVAGLKHHRHATDTGER